MKSILHLAKALVFIAILAVSCDLMAKSVRGDGNVITRDMEVEFFHAVSLSLPATVKYSESDSFSCSVQVDSNLMEHLDIRVDDGRLILAAKQKVNLRPTRLIIEIGAPTLDRVHLAGSGSLQVGTDFSSPVLDLDIAGSGRMVFSGASAIRDLDISIAGSGDLCFKDLTSDSVDVSVAGSGDLRVEEGYIKGMNISVAGSGAVKTLCRMDTMTYSIAGSGLIQYVGDVDVSGRTAGSGKIKRIR